MDDEEHPHERGATDTDEPFGTREIGGFDGERVGERGHGLFERNAVLAHVERGLRIIPLEVTEAHRSHAATMTGHMSWVKPTAHPARAVGRRVPTAPRSLRSGSTPWCAA